MTETPVAVSRRTTPNSTSISESVRIADGSSRISTRASPASAFAIETCCCSAMDSVPTGTVAYRAGSPSSSSSSTTLAFCSAQAIRPPLRSSRPVKMFSDTVSSGNSWGSWYTVAIPNAIASPVESMLTGRPSNSIVPVSADSTPAMILIMVDLPAPFSPTRACTWPGLIVISPLRTACTAPKRFDMPVSRSRGTVVGVAVAPDPSPCWESAGWEPAGRAGACDGWSIVMVEELRCPDGLELRTGPGARRERLLAAGRRARVSS